MLLALNAAPGPASAESQGTVADLAQRAKTDRAVLDELQRVEDVDGQPVDFHAALDGATGDDLDRRLDQIASAAAAAEGTPAAAPDGARREAQRILSGDRYTPDEPPRPLRGVLRKLGEWAEPVLRRLAPVGRVLSSLFDNRVGVGAVAVVVIVAAAGVATWLLRRRSRVAPAPPDEFERLAKADPRDVDKEADAAEAAGDLERAFRLRFVAGLLRLDRAGALRFRPWQTTGELVREVPSTTFGGLARDFDEIAYGGRRPEPADLARAKSDWPRVLEEARR